MEYDPHPPFDSGHPRSADQQIVATVRGFVGDKIPQANAIIEARRHAVTAQPAELAA